MVRIDCPWGGDGGVKSDEQWDGDVDGLSRGRRGALESERQEWQQRSDDLHGE